MNEFWNLTTIYTGFDDPCFDADMTALKEKVGAMAELADSLATIAPIDGLRLGIELQEQVQSLVMKLAEPAAKHMNPGGVFISSGILVEKKEIVAAAIREAGFKVTQIVTDGEWCALKAERK